MEVPDGLKQCIRILIHWNTVCGPKDIVHVYLRGAKNLRPDRNELPPIPLEEIEAAVNFKRHDLK
jgi:chorismate mutase